MGAGSRERDHQRSEWRERAQRLRDPTWGTPHGRQLFKSFLAATAQPCEVIGDIRARGVLRSVGLVDRVHGFSAAWVSAGRATQHMIPGIAPRSRGRTP
jgi:hypothetical protein